MTRDEYAHALARHDWGYEYSEDHRVWKTGQAQRALLHKARLAHDPDGHLWNQHAPTGHKIPTTTTERTT